MLCLHEPIEVAFRLNQRRPEGGAKEGASILCTENVSRQPHVNVEATTAQHTSMNTSWSHATFYGNKKTL